jgi:omega-hydroxy-beta-dihydromenaquinone-9 sulfotransferase
MRNNRSGKNFKLLGIISKTFRLKHRYIILFLFNTLLSWLNSFFFFLDKIFSPSLKRQQLDRPVYLIGHLRSGTTFLHRFLSENCDEFRMLYLREMILPPLTLKRLIKPFTRRINRISLDKVYDPRIHKTGLNKEETDDIALYFRFLDGMLSWIYFHAWQQFESVEKLRASLLEVCNQTRFVRYLKDVYRIIAFQSKKRILSKSFSALFYLEEILKENPDARIIILIRDPKEAIPSLMSLEESVQNNMHGVKNVEKHRSRYFSNLYQLSVYYYSVLENTYLTYKDHDNFLFLSYNELKDNFDKTIQSILKFCEVSGSQELEEAVSRQSGRQENFKSAHSYSLERFGLDEKLIEADTPFWGRFVSRKK